MSVSRASKTFAAIFLLLILQGLAHAQDKTPRLYSIPATTLADSLIIFAKQSKLFVLVDAEVVSGVQVSAIERVMTVDEGLQHLLQGTGLGYAYINDKTIAISSEYNVQQPDLKSGDSAAVKKDDKNKLTPIDNIIVTSLRQRKNLQKTSAAISVIDQQAIEYDAIDNLEAVGSRVPGLTVSSFSLGQPTIRIRGKGSNDDGPAMNSSVGVFIDDVYMGRITGVNLDMVDVAQIEVLRGPQGVLYGKNVIGGAIKLKTNGPTEEPEVSMKLSLGNLGFKKAEVITNGQLSAAPVLARLVVHSSQRDGWQDNIVGGGEKQHGAKQWGVRSQLLYVLSESSELLWGVDYTEDNLSSTGRVPVGGKVPLVILDDEGAPIPVEGSEGEFETRLPTDIFSELGGDPQHATNSTKGFTRRSMFGLSQRLSYQFDEVDFVAISAWRDVDFKWLEDSVGLPEFAIRDTISLLDDEAHRQFSQEFRWSSDADQKLSYVTGLYFLYEHTERKESFIFRAATASSDQENRTESYAAFGQFNYRLSPELAIGLGARYTYDSKTLRQTSITGGASSIIFEDFNVSSRANWDDFSPQLTLSYDADSNLMVYCGASRGWKSGGFQGVPGIAALAVKEVQPEYSWDYELGLKSEWLDNRLRFNVASFYTDYHDSQVVQFQTTDNFGLFQTSNAASATVKGVELEVWGQLSNYLGVSGTYAYLDATFDRFIDLNGRDFSGSSLEQSPRHTISAALQYRRPLLGGDMRLRVDYRYQSLSYREPDNGAAPWPPFSLVNASINYQPNDKRWELSLWSKNLLGEEYISHLYLLGGNNYALYGTPRQLGISLNWHFL
ncbi:TonB-dependent receptor domain-containing protein [Dasania marina]|uniref:TonB-dependent receptor domain-containing protein n=1 Tax=Dasania marina TaxID=471499 RepID=UPI00036DD75C|nr:TonB-dependent receptor [Dasania marina]